MKLKSMAFTIGLVACAGAATGAAAAPAPPALMAPIHQFIDAMNKGDMKAAGAPYASDVSIIDELPPYTWRGAHAFQDWVNDFGADAKKNGMTDPTVQLGRPSRADVNGTHGYVVAPAVFKFKDHGKPMAEPAHMTFALINDGGWKISSWAWTGGTPRPAAAAAPAKAKP
ncbi:MAG: hypothetical protein JWP50_1161 [Phenylobacterium sp.]|nr:hypothetical protein [Phenylobacterium sp.]